MTDKPYAAFITHGGGGKAIESLHSLAATFNLNCIAEPVLARGYPTRSAVADLRTLGAKLSVVDCREIQGQVTYYCAQLEEIHNLSLILMICLTDMRMVISLGITRAVFRLSVLAVLGLR